MRIGLLWAAENSGLYSNIDFDTLFTQVGHNNGNLAFVYAIRSQLKGEIKTYPWHVDPEVLNREVDVIVFPAANQLGQHTELGRLGSRFRMINKPVIVIGLGAQSESFDEDITLKEGTRDWLDALIENGQKFGIQNIYTRGPYTSQQILKLTGAETLANGCPTHFINPNPDLGRRIEDNWNKEPYPRRIAVAAGHEAWRHLRKIEQQLVSLMMDPQFPGVYITQSMANMVKLSRGLFDEIENEDLIRLRDYIIPHYSMPAFKDWALNYAKSYYDVPSWMDELRRHDLLIGARFHGAQLAIQAERMACTVTIDTRTEEMCRETGVPYLPASMLTDALTRETLKEKISFNGQSYDEHRSMKAGRYVDFLMNAGLIPADFLRTIAQR